MFFSTSGFFCMKRWALIEMWVPMRILTFSWAPALPVAASAVHTNVQSNRRSGFIRVSSGVGFSARA